jgi:LysR family cys regulon transcriptional activator
MKLQQLLYLTRVIQCQMNISESARTLHTSQSGVSRYLAMLEDELGTQIFVREEHRLVGLTQAGAEIAKVAQRMLQDAQILQRIGRSNKGDELTIATAHSHARYTLPPVIEKFVLKFPKVHIRLLQGNLAEIARWTIDGTADFLIATAPSEPVQGLVLVPCRQSHRIIIVPAGHPLLRIKNVTLEKLAEFPIIAYDQTFSMRSQLIDDFQREGLTPNIVLSAADSEVIKTYVRTGIGIAILARTVFDEKQDKGLKAIDARHLFGTHTIYVGFRRNTYLSEALLHFVQLYAPDVPLQSIESAAKALPPAYAGTHS